MADRFHFTPEGRTLENLLRHTIQAMAGSTQERRYFWADAENILRELHEEAAEQHKEAS